MLIPFGALDLFSKIGDAIMDVFVKIVLGISMLLAFLAFDNDKIESAEEAETAILKQLESKYEQDFKICTLEYGESSGPFTVKCYNGTAASVDAPEKTFDVYIQTREAELKDNYGSVLYGDRIKEEVNEALDNDSILVENLEIRFLTYSGTFEDYESYKDSNAIDIDCDIMVNAENYEDGVEIAYSVLEQFRERNLYCYMHIKILDKEEHVVRTKDRDFISKQELLERFGD